MTNLEKLLPYYRALQPFFREVMGEWKVGDALYDTVLMFLDYYTREDMSNKWKPPESWLWIPRTIDDSSPEALARSLWGMATGYHKILTEALGEFCFRVDLKVYVAGTTTGALLKALCTQWGAEGCA